MEDAIGVEKSLNPTYHGLYRLSPSKQKAVINIENLLTKRKIRRTKPPYGVLVFFVKEISRARGVIDYRALNEITKRNSASIPETDEILDSIENAKVFSIIYW